MSSIFIICFYRNENFTDNGLTNFGKILWIIVNYFQIHQKLIFLCFYRTKNFTDSGLANFGKSLENLLSLDSTSLHFSR